MIRIAVYWAPPPGSPLAEAAARWLGRDAFSGAVFPAAIAEADTASARGYGFHSTLKPPCALADGVTEADFRAVAATLAAEIAPFTLPPLRPTILGRFVALTMAAPCRPLHAMARALVTGLDPLRRPAPDGELARRRAAGLTPEQEANLVRWGYPYVLDTWQFHMTLTDALPPGVLQAHRHAAEAHFAGLCETLAVTAVTLFVQPASGAPFVARDGLPLGGTRSASTAFLGGREGRDAAA